MGKIHDALKKAEREREERRRSDLKDDTAEVPVQRGPAANAPDKTVAHAALAEAATPVNDWRTAETLVPELPKGREVSAPEAAPAAAANPSPATVPLPQRPSVTDPSFEVDLAVQTAKTLTGGIPTTRVTSRDETPGGGMMVKTISKSGREAVRRVDPGLIAAREPGDPRVEQFRSIRANLESLVPEPKVVVVTSATEGEGKALTGANLATVLAEGSVRRVLFVDADLRSTDKKNLFGIDEQRKGLAEVLAGAAAPLAVIQESSVPNLHVIHAGGKTGNPGALLASPSIAAALRMWRSAYDRIVIVAPAVQTVTDAVLIGRETDGVVFVLRLGAAPRRTTTKALDQLGAAKVRVVGIVLTDAESQVATTAPGPSDLP